MSPCGQEADLLSWLQGPSDLAGVEGQHGRHIGSLGIPVEENRFLYEKGCPLREGHLLVPTVSFKQTAEQVKAGTCPLDCRLLEGSSQVLDKCLNLDLNIFYLKLLTMNAFKL